MSGAVDVTIATGAPWPDHVAVLRGAEVRCYSLREAKAARLTKFNRDTDHATGHSECSVCGGTVNPFAAFCEHCGVKFVEVDE